MLVRAMLQAAGHSTGDPEPEVTVTDDPARAAALASKMPVLLLIAFSEVPSAIRAMEAGAFGYVLTPLQPGEVQVMARRALESISSAAVPRQDLRPLAEVEREHILNVLRACGHNHAKAAAQLGIGRNTLWRKLRAYSSAYAPQPGEEHWH